MTITITTPIYYVNDRPHIGHAYTSVACDVLARFYRLSGQDVFFLTGTDEHGQKVEKSAASAGTTPQAMADANSLHFREMAALMNISYDDFIRTTEPRHIKSAQALWAKMAAKGHIYLGSYAGWYAVRDEAYYAESELVAGEGGKKFAPTGAEVEWVEEPSYFFDLSKWQDKLLSHYEANPSFIQPESRRNEIISFVKGGLKDLSISRTTFSWGIPVPDSSPNRGEAGRGASMLCSEYFEKESPHPDPLPMGEGKHIMYVWLDALTNYLSALGYPDLKPGTWPASLHMVGKDIIRFHTVYWPAFLMAADLELPKQVFAHGWWTIEGEKMSKSLGNVVAPADLVAEYGLDQTRWFLLREVPFGNDGNFSRERMVAVINSELANNLGNLCQRTLSMIAKNCEGNVPQGEMLDEGLKSLCYGSLAGISALMDEKKFHLALEKIVEIGVAANGFIDREAPWALKKTDPARMEQVLYTLAETIRCIGLLLQPIMPDSAAKILDQLAVPPEQRHFAHLSPQFALKSGTPLPAPSGVFPRVGGAA